MDCVNESLVKQKQGRKEDERALDKTVRNELDKSKREEEDKFSKSRTKLISEHCRLVT